MPKLTPQQQQTVSLRGENMLISAAAGSGKTFVLVERIIALLSEGQDIARLVVMTFSRAAAAELKQRLSAKIEELIEHCSDDAERLRWEEQLTRLPLCNISTIHSFCKSLLDRYFEQAGLEAGFTAADEPQREQFMQLALEQTLDLAYDDETLAGRLRLLGNMRAVKEKMTTLYYFLTAQPDPKGWLNAALAQYEQNAADPGHSLWAIERQNEGVRLLRQANALLDQAVTICKQFAPRNESTIYGDLERSMAIYENPQSEVSFPSIKAIRGTKTAEEEQVAALRKRYKALFDAAQAQLAPLSPVQIRRVQHMQGAVSALAELTSRFMDAFARIKRDGNVVDFSDMEQLTLRLLEDDAIASNVRAGIDHIFIDEYQDSSAVQEAIIARIENGHNRFMVGDVKQSIYRFRQAEPQIFSTYQQNYQRGIGGSLISLNRNFRSNPGVLHAVNDVFSACMQGGDAEIIYDDDAALHVGDESLWPAPSVTALHIIQDDKETRGESSRHQAEAQSVATIIKSLVGTPMEGSGQPIQYKDIVILMRAVSTGAQAYIDTFAANGIPLYISAGGGYFDTLEIRGIQDYLTALDNPQKEIPLLGAMRAVGRFTAEELAQIRLMGKPQKGRVLPFYSCAKLYAVHGETKALREKLSAFVSLLWRFRRLSKTLPVSSLVELALEETGYLDYCLSLPGGRTRQANLQNLIAKAKNFDRADLGLSDFLRFAATAKATNMDGNTPTLTQNDDVVRLMTIHASKGLEFPIVIGAGLGNAFSKGGVATPKVYLDKELGIGLDYYNDELKTKATCLPVQAIKAKKKRQETAEEMRLLYVLMTRAKHKLILSGIVAKLEEKCMQWAEQLEPPGCMLDLICPMLMAHKDGEALRKLAGVDASTTQNMPSAWELHISPPGSGSDAPSAAGVRELLAKLDEDLPSAGPSENPFMLDYQGERSLGLPQKQSVLKSIHADELDASYIHLRPRFLRKAQDLSPAEIGTAMHDAMRFVSLEALVGLHGAGLRAELQRQVETMRQTALLDEQQADAVDVQALCTFFEGPLGNMLLSSKNILREHPFVLRDGENGLIQGIIDLCFQKDDGSFALIDYKTDRRGLDEQSVRQRHGPQLGLYRQAMVRAGHRVSTCAVYLFMAGTAVEFDLH